MIFLRRPGDRGRSTTKMKIRGISFLRTSWYRASSRPCERSTSFRPPTMWRCSRESIAIWMRTQEDRQWHLCPTMRTYAAHASATST